MAAKKGKVSRQYTLKVSNGKVRRVYVGTTTTAKRTSKPRGRPPQHTMPEPIDAPPERVAEVVLQAKPKRTWRYMEQARTRPNPGAEG